MKMQHYVTFDRGGGPVSLVEAHLDEGVRMVRITHNARFDQVKEVDPVATRQAIDSAQDLGAATTKVRPELAQKMTQEMLRWAAQHGCTSQAIRWGDDGAAIFFRTEADAVTWSQGPGAGASKAEPPARRRRIMG